MQMPSCLGRLHLAAAPGTGDANIDNLGGPQRLYLCLINPRFYVLFVVLTWQKQKQGQGGPRKPKYPPNYHPTDIYGH